MGNSNSATDDTTRDIYGNYVDECREIIRDIKDKKALYGTDERTMKLSRLLLMMDRFKILIRGDINSRAIIDMRLNEEEFRESLDICFATEDVVNKTKFINSLLQFLYIFSLNPAVQDNYNLRILFDNMIVIVEQVHGKVENDQ